ncbi:putative Plasma-membrane choline transporter [Blattamonas nauphoetae]|uniref:Plasma-membrane choline transporter n=1 Tax=Blattamonas nauphoetae TaxID=2049346 RepID=A0ABQ9XH06_9EUKA|nr:putative Plasma-membrane choline transporter [Blattamonas nauphoetae]
MSGDFTLNRHALKAREYLVRQKAAREYIEHLLGTTLPDEPLPEILSDGVILCQMLAKVNPGLVKKFHDTPKHNFHKMENILYFNSGVANTLQMEPYVIVPSDIVNNKFPARLIDCVLVFAKRVGEMSNWTIGSKIDIQKIRRTAEFSDNEMKDAADKVKGQKLQDLAIVDLNETSKPSTDGGIENQEKADDGKVEQYFKYSSTEEENEDEEGEKHTDEEKKNEEEERRRREEEERVKREEGERAKREEEERWKREEEERLRKEEEERIAKEKAEQDEQARKEEEERKQKEEEERKLKEEAESEQKDDKENAADAENTNADEEARHRKEEEERITREKAEEEEKLRKEAETATALAAQEDAKRKEEEEERLRKEKEDEERQQRESEERRKKEDESAKEGPSTPAIKGKVAILPPPNMHPPAKREFSSLSIKEAVAVLFTGEHLSFSHFNETVRTTFIRELYARLLTLSSNPPVPSTSPNSSPSFLLSLGEACRFCLSSALSENDSAAIMALSLLSSLICDPNWTETLKYTGKPAPNVDYVDWLTGEKLAGWYALPTRRPQAPTPPNSREGGLSDAEIKKTEIRKKQEKREEQKEEHAASSDEKPLVFESFLLSQLSGAIQIKKEWLYELFFDSLTRTLDARVSGNWRAFLISNPRNTIGLKQMKNIQSSASLNVLHSIIVLGACLGMRRSALMDTMKHLALISELTPSQLVDVSTMVDHGGYGIRRVLSTSAKTTLTLEDGHLEWKKSHGCCRDAICAMIFLLLVVAYVALFVISFFVGNPDKLIRPIDSAGNICGVKNIGGEDFRKRPYLFRPFNPNSSIEICVEECAPVGDNCFFPNGRWMPASLPSCVFLNTTGNYYFRQSSSAQILYNYRCVESMSEPKVYIQDYSMFTNLFTASVSDLMRVWWVLAAAIGVAVILSFLAYCCFQCSNACTTCTCHFITIIVTLAGGVAFIIIGMMYTKSDTEMIRASAWVVFAFGIVSIFFFIVYLVMLFTHGKRIARSGRVLHEAGKKAMSSIGNCVVPIIFTIIFCAAVALFIQTTVGFSSVLPKDIKAGEKHDRVMQGPRWVILIEFVLFLWIAAFLIEMAKLISAGLGTNKYFARQDSQVQYAGLKVTSVSFFKHFGSVAIGSLLILIGKLFRQCSTSANWRLQAKKRRMDGRNKKRQDRKEQQNADPDQAPKTQPPDDLPPPPPAPPEPPLNSNDNVPGPYQQDAQQGPFVGADGQPLLGPDGRPLTGTTNNVAEKFVPTTYPFELSEEEEKPGCCLSCWSGLFSCFAGCCSPCSSDAFQTMAIYGRGFFTSTKVAGYLRAENVNVLQSFSSYLNFMFFGVSLSISLISSIAALIFMLPAVARVDMYLDGMEVYTWWYLTAINIITTFAVSQIIIAPLSSLSRSVLFYYFADKEMANRDGARTGGEEGGEHSGYQMFASQATLDWMVKHEGKGKEGRKQIAEKEEKKVIQKSIKDRQNKDKKEWQNAKKAELEQNKLILAQQQAQQQQQQQLQQTGQSQQPMAQSQPGPLESQVPPPPPMGGGVEMQANPMAAVDEPLESMSG